MSQNLRISKARRHFPAFPVCGAGSPGLGGPMVAMRVVDYFVQGRAGQESRLQEKGARSTIPPA
jgi:hypothetical protein